jgi:hypothetical protein
MRTLFGLLAAAVLALPAAQAGATGSGTPLVGAAYAQWGFKCSATKGMGIVATYDEPGVRRKVRLQLAAMHAAGLDSLRLLLWYGAQGDAPDGLGTVSSQTGRLEAPYRLNLVHFLTDIRLTGFNSLTVDFGPMGSNDPIGWDRDHNYYDPSLFEQDWSFIRDVRPLVKTYGPVLTRIDILSEGAPSDNWPWKAQMMAYISEMYRRYADAFGTEDVVVSAIAPPEPYTGIDQPDVGHRLQNLIDALRASGRPLPNAFSVHPATWWHLSGAYTLWGLHQEDATLTANGLSQPLIVSETAYDDRDLADAIEEFRRTSSRPILEVQEWPLARGSSCRDFSVAPPFRADAYIQALTGHPRDKTLAATVTAAGRVTLSAPYAQPAAALVEDTYMVVVSDHSHRLSFRLVGPRVRLHTSAGTTGTVKWRVHLRRGRYRYGSGAELRGRLVVLRAPVRATTPDSPPRRVAPDPQPPPTLSAWVP